MQFLDLRKDWQMNIKKQTTVKAVCFCKKETSGLTGGFGLFSHKPFHKTVDKNYIPVSSALHFFNNVTNHFFLAHKPLLSGGQVPG